MSHYVIEREVTTRHYSMEGNGLVVGGPSAKASSNTGDVTIRRGFTVRWSL